MGFKSNVITKEEKSIHLKINSCIYFLSDTETIRVMQKIVSCELNNMLNGSNYLVVCATCLFFI